MEYRLALLISGHIAFLATVIAMFYYVYTIRTIRDRVSTTTYRALWFYGAASVFLSLLILVVGYTPSLIVQRIPILLFNQFLLNAVSHIATENRRVHYVTYGISAIVLFITIFIVITRRTTYSPFLSTVVSIFIISLILITLGVIIQSPSPFTIGFLIQEVSFLVFWILATNGLLYSTPEVYPLVFIPATIATALLGSILKPWRRIVSLYLFTNALFIGLGLIVAAFLTGETIISLFVIVILIPVIPAMLSLEFFAEQMSITKAVVPTYITTSLVALSLMIVVLSVDWAFGYFTATIFPSLDWLELVLGIIMGSAALLAGLATFLQRGLKIIRRFLLAFIVLMAVLGLPYVQNGRWTIDDLLFAVIPIIAIAIIAYTRTAIRLRRLGAVKAARNFVAFMLGILISSIAILGAFDFPIIVSAVLFVTGAIALTFSSPKILKPRAL